MKSVSEAFILGIVQGITEFLPISSTAHLRIVPALFHWSDPGTAFSAVLQIGTMVAVVIYFWKDLIKMYEALIKDFIFLCSGGKTNELIRSYESKLALWILLGTVPICIFGFLFKKPIEEGMVRDLNIVAFYLIFFGILLFFSEIIAKETRVLTSINALDVLLIGLAQSFALIPGVSRSGVTLFAGLLLGFKRPLAARFSFLLSVPAVLASSVLELNTLILNIESTGNRIIWSDLLIGIVAACASGYFAIDFLLKYLQTRKTHVFVLYRVLIGALVIYLNCRGLIH
ncbi:MAG: undecaprenyl-diphosphatase UppP [Candidatus Melainabacteria bacterium]|nr:undecaprenyl-diphosphatase UppP [Candidatus Melainabacteria bacterium]